METATIGVRVGRDLWTRFNVEAQALGVSLGTYVRRRLEEQDHVAAQLEALRAAIAQGPAASVPPSPSPPLIEGAIVELLLLLRQIAGPQKALLAQKEVERRGLPTWR
jgi:hypothetical protein